MGTDTIGDNGMAQEGQFGFAKLHLEGLMTSPWTSKR